MNTLKINFTPLQWDGVSEQELKSSLFGLVRISINSPIGAELTKVLEAPLELRDIVIWAKANRDALLKDKIPVGESGALSIAEAVFQFYDQLDINNQTNILVDRMYNYRVAHGLRFAFAGTDIPDIYIGDFRNKHEISLYNENMKWSYQIDMEKFLSELTEMSLHANQCQQ